MIRKKSCGSGSIIKSFMVMTDIFYRLKEAIDKIISNEGDISDIGILVELQYQNSAVYLMEILCRLFQNSQKI